MKSLLKLVLVKAILFLMTTSAAAQTASTMVINNRTLRSSNFALIQGPSISALMSGCPQGSSCSSPPVSVLGANAWNVVCPVAAGHTCTYEITLTGPIFAYSGQDGVVAGVALSYSGDGSAFCISGGTCGATNYLYVPSNAGPIGAYKFFVSVKNTASWQSHSVQINLQCITGTTGACQALLGSNMGNTLNQTVATLQTDVYTP